MRTSASQFEVIVSFMERHGDLSRPSDGPHGRLTNIQRWSELVSILNSDATGDSKVEEKWKKTWSDLKNNTKRKAAKINRAATGTGGGPASKAKLTDIEERVLAIMNPQAVTGILEVPEIGLEQDVSEQDPIDPDSLLTAADVLLTSETLVPDPLESWNEAGSSSQLWAQQSQPQRHPPQTPEPQRGSPHSPPATPPPVRRRHDHQPTRQSHDTRQSKRMRPATSTQSELARQCFVNSDRKWREFNIEKTKKDHELEKERLRLREIELQQQAKWQEICAQFLLVLEKVSSNILNKD